jgi:hypothetical protein
MATLASPTIDELISDVRTMLGQTDATNSTWGDEELTQYLNEGVRRYFAEAVLRMEGAFVTTTTLECTSGQDYITLPSDFFKVKNLYIKDGDGYRLLPYRNNLTDGYLSSGDTGSSMYAPSYAFRGNTKLILHPVPGFTSTGGTFLLEYVAFPTTLVSGGDSLTSHVSPIFKDLIEMYAVYKAKLRESLTSGTNTAELALQNLNDLYTAFQQVISQMSANPTFVLPWHPEE